MSTIILDNITVCLDKDQNVTLAKDNLSGRFVSLKLANEMLHSSIVACNNVQHKALSYSIHSMRLFVIITMLFSFMARLVHKSVKRAYMNLYSVLANIKLIDLALFVSSIVFIVLTFI